MDIRIKFCNGVFAAAGDTHRKQEEWPPSPYRLYCALVDACYQLLRGTGEDFRDELLKLESSVPPVIFTPIDAKKVSYGTYVPSNVQLENEVTVGRWLAKDPRTSVPTQKKIFKNWTRTSCGEVFFRWETKANIEPLFKWIDYIGQSHSKVSVDQSSPKGVFDVWFPENGNKELRCPYDGILESLDLMYDEARKQGGKVEQVTPRKICYKKIRMNVVADPVVVPKQDKIWDTFYILSLDSDCLLDINKTCSIAESMRKEMGNIAKSLKLETFESELIGLASHDTKPHVSYLPLPHVTGPYPSGHIKGIMVCLPKAMSEFYDDFNACLSKIKTLTLSSDIQISVGERKNSVLKTLSRETWVDRSFEWTSATPVECWYGDEEKKRKWCEKQCEYLNLPKPVSIVFHRQSAWGHDAASIRKHRHQMSEPKNDFFSSHLTVRFPISVSGPIAIGHGRNFGLGLMVPKNLVKTC